ncbi:MAG: hypothetical protein M3214_00025 [Actinomycetota bacterium]|nr:hypothetical protein [Actinomycetota bacterium]
MLSSASVHPGLIHEQKYLDRAYECLSAMRARTLRLSDKELAGSADDSALVRDHLSYRLSSLEDDTKPLCFGPIDGDGEILYIGRRHVKDERDEPVVVDWRAPAATPFYRATVSDPMDLTRRRRFSVKGRRLIDIFDGLFDDPDSLLAGAHTVPDPLLAALSRARTGEMRDIVATIQAGVAFSDWTAENLDEGITLLKASVAKGLEFDSVIVVEPAEIFEQGTSGPRLLYVAMTLAVQQLVLVHSKGLPALLDVA